MFSLNDLDATKASDEAFEFEYVTPAGDSTGIFFKVLGAQSEKVTSEMTRLINDRRRKAAIREANQNSRNRGNTAVEFEPMENDIEFGNRLAAIRLVGWRGIKEDFSEENALKLCKKNRDISTQIVSESDKLANFMQIKPAN